AQQYALLTANHSRLGDLGTTLLPAGASLAIATGDSLSLVYQATADTSSERAGWYLTVRRVVGALPSPQSLRQGPNAEIPLRFALHASQPNPAGASTFIRFDLPVESSVKLEVFDLLGRRVATLTDRTFPAGRHGAAWNLRDPSGAPVRPGVYVYRLTAGEFRARGKMSVVPSGAP
ncbi:MAG: T9SS type A sorting domain-containing protein, partial [Candidatus Eiseniibacteriota bacterium]